MFSTVLSKFIYIERNLIKNHLINIKWKCTSSWSYYSHFFIWLAILFVASSIRTSSDRYQVYRHISNTHTHTKNAIKTNIKRISSKYIDPCLSSLDIHPFLLTHTSHKGVGQVVGKWCEKSLNFLFDWWNNFFLLLYFVVSCFILCSIFIQLSHVLFLFWSMFFFCVFCISRRYVGMNTSRFVSL